MILVEEAKEFKGDESIKPSLRLVDKSLSTMSIDKKVGESANCRRLCPALSISNLVYAIPFTEILKWITDFNIPKQFT